MPELNDDFINGNDQLLGETVEPVSPVTGLTVDNIPKSKKPELGNSQPNVISYSSPKEKPTLGIEEYSPSPEQYYNQVG